MKNNIIYILVLFFGILSVSAQHKEGRANHRALKKEFYQNLSQGQKDALDNKKRLRKEHKETMKASFTKDQLAIVEDETLSKQEKRKALRKTFSDKQKEMFENHKAFMKEEHKKFKTSLSDIQIEQYEKLEKKRCKIRQQKKG